MNGFTNKRLLLKWFIGVFATSLFVIAGWNIFFFVCPGFGQEYLPSPAQRVAMPGTGTIECSRAGLYRIYFVEQAVLQDTNKGRIVVRNPFVSKLADRALDIHTIMKCKILDSITSVELPINCAANLGSYSSSDDVSDVIGFATFVAPRAGKYDVICSTSEKTLSNCYLEVLPQDWDEIGPMIQSCAAHLILKGSILRESDITRERPFTKGTIVGANNMVQDKREVIGCRTKRTLWPGNYIRYSDVEIDWSRLRHE